jgi:hypothetical protein
MGWVEADEWREVRSLSLESENQLLLQARPQRGLIGIDCYGVDLIEDGKRSRLGFGRAVSEAQLPEVLRDLDLLA